MRWIRKYKKIFTQGIKILKYIYYLYTVNYLKIWLENLMRVGSYPKEVLMRGIMVIFSINI